MFGHIKFSLQSFKDLLKSMFVNLKTFSEDIKYKFDNLYETNYNTGLHHLECGNIWDATFRFKIVSKFWPNKVEGRYQYALCLVLQGMVEDAKRVLEDILKKDSNFDKAKELLKKIENNEAGNILLEFNKNITLIKKENSIEKDEETNK